MSVIMVLIDKPKTAEMLGATQIFSNQDAVGFMAGRRDRFIIFVVSGMICQNGFPMSYIWPVDKNIPLSLPKP